MITFLFILIASGGLATNYLLRQYLSSENLKPYTFLLCVLFNLLFIFTHMKIVYQKCIIFLGCFPHLHEDYPIIAWTSLLYLFLHCFASPVRWTPKGWFRKKTKGVDL